MKAKNLGIMFLVLAILLTACSVQEQVRLRGTIHMGDLPSDMLYVDGQPQIVTVSTESDGDILLSYISTNGKLIVQMYGCNYVTLTCGDIHKQGQYVWDLNN